MAKEQLLLATPSSSANMKLLLVMFLITHVSTISEDLPELANFKQENEEVLYNIFEQTYSVRRSKTASVVGEPLLLTPYIEEGRLEEARAAARVDPDALLPDIDSYSAFFTVDKQYNSNLWFWFFPASDKNIEDTPWIIWLQGGPGASSLYGLFTEIGPLYVDEDNNLQEMKYSWGKNYSLLFIDNPVGTGYSFTNDEQGYATNQTQIGEQLYLALQQFLTVFPELRKAPLFIAGESYAGKHIPSLAWQIHKKHESEPAINLQGLAIGNGFIDPQSLQRYSYFVREVGLVDDKIADIMKFLEQIVVEAISQGNAMKAYKYYNYLLGLFMDKSYVNNLYNYLNDDISLDGPHFDFIQSAEARNALHVGNGNFTSIGLVYRKLIPDFMNSAKGMLEELLSHYRVMSYNGHLDIIVAYHPSVNTHKALNFSGSKLYRAAERKPWYHNNELAGYYKVAGNLTEVMVRKAGHMVPGDAPAAALGLISAFIKNIPLSRDTGPLAQPEEKIRRRQLQLS